jgi:glycosyltransferase involved in cell wall biosynthesis
MRVLVVLTQPPLSEGGAPGRVAIGLLRGLMAHGIEVRALAARQHFAVTGEVPSGLPLEVVEVDPPRPGFRHQLDRLRRPRGELRGPFAALVREAAREVDVVHLEETETAWCDEGVSTPSLVHMHYLVRRDRPLGWPWQKRFREVGEVRLGERAAIRRHRYLVASSPVIAQELRAAAPRAEVVHAPLSLDPSLYLPAPLDGPSTAGLIGTASWPPNAEAIERLTQRVWPLVQERVPEAKLVVAGHGTEALGFSGPVESGRDFLRRLSVLIFPLERGSGMKVKVLEAMASGVPVVTTPAGAEGIPKGIRVETGDEQLATAAAELLGDPDLRRRSGAAARDAFERLYTPQVATQPLVELYERMAR